MALLLPPLARGERRGALLDVARERQRGAPDLGVRPASLDADVDVDAARAGGLGPADEADGVERLARDERDLADLVPLDAGDRVEVHAQLVGVVEVVGADRVRVEVDAAEVDDPRQLRGVADDDLLGGPT